MREILQLAITGIVASVSLIERVAWSLILAIAIGTILFLGGCASNQLPSVSVDITPAGNKTQAALPTPAPQVVVVQPAAPTITPGVVNDVPQK